MNDNIFTGNTVHTILIKSIFYLWLVISLFIYLFSLLYYYSFVVILLLLLLAKCNNQVKYSSKSISSIFSFIYVVTVCYHLF
jgi:hypothetical protein